jgi:hypothetical protein
VDVRMALLLARSGMLQWGWATQRERQHTACAAVAEVQAGISGIFLVVSFFLYVSRVL